MGLCGKGQLGVVPKSALFWETELPYEEDAENLG